MHQHFVHVCVYLLHLIKFQICSSLIWLGTTPWLEFWSSCYTLNISEDWWWSLNWTASGSEFCTTRMISRPENTKQVGFCIYWKYRGLIYMTIAIRLSVDLKFRPNLRCKFLETEDEKIYFKILSFFIKNYMFEGIVEKHLSPGLICVFLAELVRSPWKNSMLFRYLANQNQHK